MPVARQKPRLNPGSKIKERRRGGREGGMEGGRRKEKRGGKKERERKVKL